MKFRDEIIGLWSLGVKSGTIAGLLGISRSAVLGKVYRLRAEGVDMQIRAHNQIIYTGRSAPRPGPVYLGTRVGTLKPKAPMPAPIVKPVLPPAPPEGISILNIGYAQCRWEIARDDSPYRLAIYCGAGTEVVRGHARSYCPEHCKLAYNQTEWVRKPRRPDYGR